MPPNYSPGTDTDYQRWLASQSRRTSDDSIPSYGPYENDPYEAYDGEDVRPDNVASYDAMHKVTNPYVYSITTKFDKHKPKTCFANLTCVLEATILH